MNTRRIAAAGLLTIFVTSALAGEGFARETRRLAFNAGGLLPPSADSLLPADWQTLVEAKTVHALQQAAELGDTQARLDLGLRYETGRGVLKDTTLAIKWLRLAAEQGSDEAQYSLGCCYNGDEGFPRHPVEAVKWWGQAAAQGHADAQFCLGLSFSQGEGVAQDPIAAAKWWSKAAEQDHAGAQYFLGLSYSLGLGVPKIQDRAVFWLRKAAINGDENALAALRKMGQDSDLPVRKRSAGRSAPSTAVRGA